MSVYSTMKYDHSAAFGSYNYNSMPTRKPSYTSSGSTHTFGLSEKRRTGVTGRTDYSPTICSSTYRSRTPSIPRNTSPIRSTYGEGKYDDLEKRTRALISSPIDSRGRPLPKGPSTVDTSKQLKNLRSNLQRNGSLSRDVGATRRPVKADYTYSSKETNYGSLDRYSRGSLDRDTTMSPSRLSRSKRSGSVADLTGKFEDLQTDPGIKNSRKYGSSVDISGLSSRSSNQSNTADCSSLRGGKHTRTISHSHTDSSTLPDISVTNKASASPLFDGDYPTSRNSDDDNAPSSKRSYVSSRHNSNKSVSYTNGTNDRISAENINMVNNSGGIVGLRNIGNTCFMNSVLQCLSNTKVLLEYCLNENYKAMVNTKTSSMKGQLIKVYASVMKSLWRNSNETYITPQEFKNQIARYAKRFVGYNQQDAQEFLIYLLEGLHEDINMVQEKKQRFIDDSSEVETISASEKAVLCWNRYLDHDNSKVVELFVGQLRSCLTCMECGYVSNTFDPFWDLSVPINKSTSCVRLKDCLKLFTQEEILDGDERPTCAQCKKRQQCSKRFSIQRFPKVLILHLKRFNQGSYYRSKLSTMVDFPIDRLDMTEFSTNHNECAVYNLYAVSNHSGSTGGGHYTAYARNPYSGDWHHFNDQRVSPISISRVVSSEAYVLFYGLQEPTSHL